MSKFGVSLSCSHVVESGVCYLLSSPSPLSLSSPSPLPLISLSPAHISLFSLPLLSLSSPSHLPLSCSYLPLLSPSSLSPPHLPVGHCHPKVVEACSEQMAKMCCSPFPNHHLLEKYTSHLLTKFPNKLDFVFYTNSGYIEGEGGTVTLVRSRHS